MQVGEVSSYQVTPGARVPVVPVSTGDAEVGLIAEAVEDMVLLEDNVVELVVEVELIINDAGCVVFVRSAGGLTAGKLDLQIRAQSQFAHTINSSDSNVLPDWLTPWCGVHVHDVPIHLREMSKAPYSTLPSSM